MSLIECGECKKPVSDKASACPNCGNPISNPNINNSRIKTVELTSKKLKMHGLIANMIVLTCAVLLIFSEDIGITDAEVGYSILSVLVFGVCLGLVTRFRFWWNHE